MQTTSPPLRTPLYEVQVQAGARFVPFAGYEMPVQFAGLVAEHQAVRTAAGLFDVSHMGEAIIEGPEALAAIQYIVTNDVAKLVDGKALYTVMCTETGGIVDDLIVYREHAERYFLCINASRRHDDVAHICKHAARFKCTVTDVSDEFAQLALQGPQAPEILARLTSYDVKAMKPFTWVDTEVDGIAGVRIASTGYTGERGYELYVHPERAKALWQSLMREGAPLGLVPCGLGARDTLRLEMKYPLYGNDIDLEHNPIEAGLSWVVKFAKGDFLGKEALLRAKEDPNPRVWVGLKLLERGGVPRAGYAIAKDGHDVGVVTSGTHSPSLGEAIATGYVPKALSAVGTKLDVMVRQKPVAAQVVETPFYKHKREEA